MGFKDNSEVEEMSTNTKTAKVETIGEIKKKYRNEWVLAEVLEEGELGEPKKLKVIAHSKDRGDTYEAMGKTKARDIAHFYTGEIPKKGYAVAFGIQ